MNSGRLHVPLSSSSGLDPGSPWAALFEQANLAIAVLTPAFDFLRVNEAYAATDGKTPEWYPGKNYFALRPHPDEQATFAAVVADGRPYTYTAPAFEPASDRQRGARQYDWTLSPVTDEAGVTICLILMLQDVIVRVHAEERAGSASRTNRRRWRWTSSAASGRKWR